MKKRTAKRMVSFVTAFVFLFVPLAIPASASTMEMDSNLQIQNALRAQYRFESSFDHVLEDEDGNYALTVEVPNSASPVLQPVGYLQVDLLDPTSVNYVLNHPNLSDEIKDTICSMAQAAEPCSECDTCNLVSIFTPDLLPQTRSTEIYYDTYNGTRMKVEEIQSDAHTDWANILRDEGADFMAEAEAIVSIYFTIAGLIWQPIGVFGAGLSILDALLSTADIDAVGSNSVSTVDVRVFFHGTTRFTSAYIEDWRIGCVSYSAYVEKLKVDYVLYDEDGNRKEDDDYEIDVSTNLETPHFGNHIETAYYNYHSPVSDDYIRLKIGTKEYVLNVA